MFEGGFLLARPIAGDLFFSPSDPTNQLAHQPIAFGVIVHVEAANGDRGLKLGQSCSILPDAVPAVRKRHALVVRRDGIPVEHINLGLLWNLRFLEFGDVRMLCHWRLHEVYRASAKSPDLFFTRRRREAGATRVP
jgi:hypothetical protein